MITVSLVIAIVIPLVGWFINFQMGRHARQVERYNSLIHDFHQYLNAISLNDIPELLNKVGGFKDHFFTYYLDIIYHKASNLDTVNPKSQQIDDDVSKENNGELERQIRARGEILVDAILNNEKFEEIWENECTNQELKNKALTQVHLFTKDIIILAKFIK